jgi:hypothetical protein
MDPVRRCAQVVGAAITGGASLMLLQTVQRAANFVLNQVRTHLKRRLV